MSISLDPSLRNLNDCGCCAGVTVETPAVISNRPGLPAIAYRVGIHAQFKASLLARLSAADVAALGGLTTRADDDFTIALLDAWATVADVLTFYQERIANECYLRTATERVSLLELARLIGYELRPGVAAGTDLAFTLENPFTPGVVPPQATPGIPRKVTLGIGTKVQSIPGPSQQPQTFETIEEVEARPEWNMLEPLRIQLPDPYVNRGDCKVYLDGLNTGLKEGDGLLFVGSARRGDITSEIWDFRQVTKVTPDSTNGWTLVEWKDGLGGSTGTNPANDAKVYAFLKRAALFGSNAPDPATLPDSVLLNYGHGMAAYNNTSQPWIITRQSEWNFTLGNPINLDASYPTITPSTNEVDSWIVLAVPGWHYLYRVIAVTESSPKLYTLTTKTTQLTLDASTFLGDHFLNGLRSVAVFAQSEELELAKIPVAQPIEGSTIVLAQPYDGLKKGHKIIVSGNAPGAGPNDPPISETAVIDSVIETNLTLQAALDNQYDPATVVIYGNVASATNGETQQEVLGSGDASQTFQQFILKQSPLTYISSATPGGADSTLEVRVNDLLWHEVPTFYGHGQLERIFVTRTDDDGKTTVEFGNGQTGAKLPTGQENVTVNYRKGIGTDGNLDAGQLSLLMSRSLGVKSVTNPEPATGAADRESLADARANASLTVLTLDRIVSLEDYEDFARAFAGVAKALATWTWTGEVRGVFVTVAGPDGAAIPDGPGTLANLVGAMKASGDQYIPLSVQSYRPAYFKLGVVIKCDSDYDLSTVQAAVQQTLRTAFSFDSRAFGQAVTLSEILALVQGVQGVIAVDVTRLYRTDDPAGPGLNDILTAAVPLAGQLGGTVSAAELLTLSADPLDQLGEMT
jgi:hypothetical protein